MTDEPLLHEWNPAPTAPARPIGVVDETLRDGLQGGVPRMPTVPERVRLMAMSTALGVSEITVGFPAHEQASRDCLAVCRAARTAGLETRLGVLGRMLAGDIERIARVRDGSGADITAWLFLGASPIRKVAEQWTEDRLLELATAGLRQAHGDGLPVNFGIEDAARTTPELLGRLVSLAVSEGVETVSICDTVGHLTPAGAAAVVGFARQALDVAEARVGVRGRTRLDFHNHRDRGLALAAALAAADAGADRVHGTMLGIGERAGNCPLDLLLVNLSLTGRWSHSLRGLDRYMRELAAACELTVPDHYPVLGANAFRTQAGVHAAAIAKARAMKRPDVVARVYSSVDPRMVGRDHEAQVGPASGRANVRMALSALGVVASDAALDAVLERARAAGRVLRDEEIRAIAVETAG